MSSRHVPTRRLKSGVLFSAPDDLVRVPHDELTRRPKRRRVNYVRNVAPGSGSRLVDEEVALDFSPATDQQKPFAMFAQFVGSSSYGSSTRPMDPNISKQEKETLCLPVLKVSLTATVEGTLAHMTLKQSFHNPSEMTIREARHTFPLYDGSVVTAFECTIGDERRLRGVVKPKEQARKDYKEAIRDQSKAAALLEEHTPDIFETSLGNIPPMTIVEIKIVYIQELRVAMMEGKVSEGIGLIIPTSIAPRYNDPKSAGELPLELPQGKLDIEIHILKDGHITPEGSLEESGYRVAYHGTKMMESPQRSNGEHPVNEYYFWDHHSKPPVLKKDFVFVVPMQKGHEMESRAIMSPPDESGLAAMMVSIRPNELFRNAIIPQSFSGEILFLLDQSASMNDLVANDDFVFGFTRAANACGHTKIDVLREAMHLVLAGLPKTCSFNIISWGSEPWGMWEQSRQHTPDNVMEANEFISTIEADKGGTDLLRALKSTVQRRLHDSKSTQIVVLTDGELDPKEPMEFIWRTRQELQNRIRFFSLGIGDEVPRSLIESIAELGGGFGDVVDTAQNPKWHARLNRLTKSALEPDTWDCEIDIGDQFEQRSLIDYKLNDNTSVAQRVPYFQAPSAIAGLHPFRFNSIFFLIDVKSSGMLPSEVAITTTTHGAKKKIYKLPVKLARINDGTMHQLAAKAVLMDLEERFKRGPSSSKLSSSRLAEENAQTIGTRYSITSKWTSFVALPHDEPTNSKGNLMEHYKALMDGIDISDLLDAKTEDDS
ncbi:von Willebrand factor type A domain-containing protein, partial [Fusarium flagelliforme]|uniref:von Willebrand factor type A domain-containing protein n=1 Tax=Fusarium flagelliforme TaxID=2675880 RepID=UPI001E8D6BEF